MPEETDGYRNDTVNACFLCWEHFKEKIDRLEKEVEKLKDEMSDLELENGQLKGTVSRFWRFAGLLGKEAR